MRKQIAIALTVPLVVLVIAACEPAPECLKRETRVVSVVKTVNGKITSTAEVRSVCVKYAPAKKEN